MEYVSSTENVSECLEHFVGFQVRAIMITPLPDAPAVVDEQGYISAY